MQTDFDSDHIISLISQDTDYKQLMLVCQTCRTAECLSFMRTQLLYHILLHKVQLDRNTILPVELLFYFIITG